MADTAITGDTAGGVLSLSDEKVRPDSLWRMALRRFLRHRMAVFGTLMLTSIFLFVTLGATVFTEDYANHVNVVEKFQALRDRLGITSIMVGDLDTLAPVVERLAGT